MTLEFTTSTVIYISLGIVFTTVLLILFLRRFFNRQGNLDLTRKHAGRKWDSPLTGRDKYPEVDVFSLRSTLLNYGLMMSIGLIILAFSWTTFETKTDYSLLLGDIADEIEMETPRTAEPPPPPPPPPTPTKVNIVEAELPDLETVTFEDMSISEESSVEAPKFEPKPEKVEAAPPPPPKYEQEEKEIFKIVEDAPLFPGCEDISAKQERAKCAEEALMKFIYDNIRYPNAARENGIEGMVVVRFVVEPDGSISNINVMRDIGGGCGEEAKRVVKMMPDWHPGKQRGRPVRVQFTLPIRFMLA